MIPSRVTFSGDKVKAEKLRGFGKKFLAKLEHALSFKGLPDGRDSIRLADGSVVTATVCYGRTTVHVFTPFSGGIDELIESCLCGKFFAEGVVVGTTEIEGFVTPARLYTVDVCQAGGTQITVQNCVAHDFHVHKNGDRVWCSLDIREAISCYPFYVGLETDAEHYAFATPWGALGESREFTYVSCDDTSGNYDKGSLPLVVSSSAKGPCNTLLTYPDDDWPGAYPYMCRLTTDIASCYWLYRSLQNGFVKTKESLYTEYSMLTTIGGTIDPEKDYSVKWLFNLQIIPQ